MIASIPRITKHSTDSTFDDSCTAAVCIAVRRILRRAIGSAQGEGCMVLTTETAIVEKAAESEGDGHGHHGHAH